MKLTTCPHWLALLLLTPASVLAILPTLPNNQQPLQQSQATAKSLTGLQLPFIANNGQTDPQVGFYAQTFAGTVYVTRSGELVYALPGKDKKPGWTLVERFAEGKVLPIGKVPNTSQVSYIKDQHGKAVTQNAQTYSKVALGEVFKGVQVELIAHGDNVEKVYTLAAGADAGRIKMAVAGANRLTVDTQGALLAETGNGPIRFTPPIAWQEKQGVKTPVPVSYAVANNQYGFKLGEYDHSQAVMIDPLLQATYLGGNGTETVESLAVSPITGDVYVAGISIAPGAGFTNTFPGTAGGYQSSQNGANETVFLSRLTPDLKALIQTTYFSVPRDGLVTSFHSFASLAIHPRNGDAYLLYAINDNGNNRVFPPTADTGAVPCETMAHMNYTVTRFSADLKQLFQATCLTPVALRRVTALGVYGADFTKKFAFHPHSGDLYFAGSMNPVDFNDKNLDATVVRVSEDLRSYADFTTFGSTGKDYAEDVAIHPVTGDVYVTGTTGFNDFPNTAGSYQPNNASQPATGMKPDGFIAQLSSDLDTIKKASYLGGVLEDHGLQIAVGSDPARSLYVLSRAQSKDFPALAGGAAPAVYNEAFVRGPIISKISSDLSRIEQSTGTIQLTTSGGLVQSTPLSPVESTSSQDRTQSTHLSLLTSPVTQDVMLVYAQIYYDGVATAFNPYGTRFENVPVGMSFSPDLRQINFQARINPTVDFPVNEFALSPITGDIYLAGGELSGKTHPATDGGAQPVSAVTSAGKPDIYIAHYTSTDIGVGTGGGTGGTDDNGGGSSGGTDDSGSGAVVANPDETPKTFKFATKKKVKRNALITSNKVKIKGIKAGSAPVSVQNGEYSLGCKKKGFTRLSGVIKNNKTVCVRHQSASTKKSVVTTTLTIGGAAGSFSSSTK